MYVLLLLLGAATTAAGVALVASGLTGHEAAFDTDMTTPSTIAAVGGLILIGLGLVVRGLQRVERALAAPPAPRSLRTAEAPAAVERPDAPPRIPFPAKPTTDTRAQPASVAVNIAPGSNEGAAAVEHLREKYPTLLRLENPPVVADAAVSLLPHAPGRVEENLSEVKNVSVAGIADSAPSSRVVPWIEVARRPSGPPEQNKISMFDSFWPKGQRVKREAPAMPPQTAAPPFATPTKPAQASETASDTAPGEPRAATAQSANFTSVSILKSGVVEGMAYRLYSDGSIEAQLPQGTLRFGSIAELRNHIESGS